MLKKTNALPILSLAAILATSSCGDTSSKIGDHRLISSETRKQIGGAVDVLVDRITGNDILGDVAELAIKGIIDAINLIERISSELIEYGKEEEGRQLNGTPEQAVSAAARRLEIEQKIRNLERKKLGLQDALSGIEKARQNRKSTNTTKK